MYVTVALRHRVVLPVFLFAMNNCWTSIRIRLSLPCNINKIYQRVRYRYAQNMGKESHDCSETKLMGTRLSAAPLVTRHYVEWYIQSSTESSVDPANKCSAGPWLLLAH
ncbi:hypothetical protein EDD36DRAFT_223359 [Exophiala viscosa]|uniref:Uncharacterized protein n=1 Tax=Exophiala viscosa TaxID=2486360 RepID=A0AAN6DZP2_9EURO|nr:hypothetical protein EDD36DRAFT_223359 [Exophiala viscosa]